jgi:ADP-heptose:LPS heptosyltransferase
MPERPDFSLPVPPKWREWARAKLGPTNGKPMLIYRPIVLNDVWKAPARSPDPDAYHVLFRLIRDRFHVVSIADLNQKEWFVGSEQDADTKFHHGELSFEELAGLFAEAALVFGNAGFSPVMAQAVGTPSIIVYGGNESFRTTNSVGAHLAPTLAIEPITPCECHSRTHDCDKRIDVEAAIVKVREFACRFAS